MLDVRIHSNRQSLFLGGALAAIGKSIATAFVILSFVILCGQAAHAATINAPSCSSTDVQTAINSANNGDTVVVPSGACTWASPVNISSKGVTLQGATTCSGTPLTCADNTKITIGGNGHGLTVTGASASQFVTVTGFTFVMGVSCIGGAVSFDGTPAAVAFRYHHNHDVIPTAAANSVGLSITDVYGVIDHVVFDITDTTASDHSIDIFGDQPTAGYLSWNRPAGFGTNQAVYVEDSVFNNSNQNDDVIDSYAGARNVIRHNIFNNTTVGFHGTDSGGYRSLFSTEVYNNTFTNNSGRQLRAGTMRGGTGLWHDNTYNGSTPWYNVTLQLFRACSGDIQGSWQMCNGTNWQIGSKDFTATASRTCSTSGGTKFCSTKRDTVCQSDSDCAAVSGGTCSTYFDGSGSGGYGCRDQVGRTHDQVVSPVYSWNNGNAGIDVFDSCSLTSYVQSGRDYVVGSPMPGYTAYAYPHPLQGGSTGGTTPPPTAPNPPTGLTVTVN
jgi:hypothetical protein